MIAHISLDNQEQTSKDHLYHVADLAKEYMAKIQCPNLGFLTGILHDAGKLTLAFNNYLKRAASGQRYRKGELNHSAAGGKLLSEVVKAELANSVETLTLQIISEVIFSHHSGLCDNYTINGEDSYTKRFSPKTEIYYEEVKLNFFRDILSEEEVKALFYKAASEVKRILDEISKEKLQPFFSLGLLTKFLFSCLIDADRYDTAMFCQGKDINKQKDNQELWSDLLTKVDTAVDKMNGQGEMNRLRKIISDACREAGHWKNGIYTLRCPTGAGKTFSSLRYALNHANIYHKKRIFYIIPYTTILDQNAEAIKNILGSGQLAAKSVAELHSALVVDNLDEDYKLLTERMDAPIILTTMVRFLNTFFAAGTQNSRPIHNFEDAVIIFDEIQTLPIKCIRMFNGLLNFLSKICHATCVLCTATQPLLHQTPDPIEAVQLNDPFDLARLSSEMIKRFKRTALADSRKEKGYSVEELTDFVLEKALIETNVLAIMNTKSSALKLYQSLEIRNSELSEKDRFQLFFLSTKLCPAHRKEKIYEIVKAVKDERIIVISTQLVEAGVDLDFNCVIRSLAGLDSCIQAAGRCNRQGKKACKNVYLVNPEFEPLNHLRDIQLGAECTQQILNEYRSFPNKFEQELMSEPAILRYFQLYFTKQADFMSYPVKKDGRELVLYRLLDRNSMAVKSFLSSQRGKTDSLLLPQAFEKAGEIFAPIDQKDFSLIVPYKKGAEVISQLLSELDMQKKRQALKMAQQYSVNLMENEIKDLGTAVSFCENSGVYVLNALYYDECLGVTGETASESLLCSF